MFSRTFDWKAPLVETEQGIVFEASVDDEIKVSQRTKDNSKKNSWFLFHLCIVNKWKKVMLASLCNN